MPTSSITTLLSDLTPEQKQKLRSLPEWEADLPDNVYPALELHDRKASLHRAVTTAEDFVPLHTHSFYEYIYCRQVPDMEYLVGTHRYRLRAGDVIFIPPGTPHRPIFPGSCADAFVRDELWHHVDFVIDFGQRLPPEYISNRKTPYLFRMDAHYQSELSVLFQKGAEENEKKQFRWDNAVEGYAWLLLVTMSRAVLDENTQPLQQESPNLFDRIITYLEANLSKKITLEETANHFYVSKSTVSRAFQKHIGTSFYRCLTQRRLLAAQHLILEGLPLEEVSLQVGFSDYATFYRAFKQEFGISPRQFRKFRNTQDSAAVLPYLQANLPIPPKTDRER